MTSSVNKSGLWKKHLGDWVLNPYVGCEHGCLHCYCPAMPGVRCFNQGHSQEEWGQYLYPRSGIVEGVHRQLRRFTPAKAKRTDWGRGRILVSFLTDAYTPAEATQKLTRPCLQALLEAGHQVRVQTRSALVERDFDLLKAHRDQVLLGTSLPYFDDKLARVLEPRASSPTRRLKMLEKAAQADIPVYAAIAPFLPVHDVGALREIMNRVLPLRPREIFCEVLNPKGDNIGMMARALENTHPAEAQVLRDYTQERWSHFTFEMLSAGVKMTPLLVPWPDTRRSWWRHLTADQVAFLDQFLPTAEMKEVAKRR